MRASNFGDEEIERLLKDEILVKNSVAILIKAFSRDLQKFMLLKGKKEREPFTWLMLIK